jgi:hypothetical protein
MTDMPRVLLLHGIWMPGASMLRLARRLQVEGFAPTIHAYAGVLHGPDAVLPTLRARLHGFDAVVGHSLGGLLTLSALREATDLPIMRVVCLDSPLAGSAAATSLSRHALSAWALGRASNLLQRGVGAWEGAAQVGMIAGKRPMGLGQLFSRFDGPHDGTVAVAETRVEGLSDHVVVSSSHTGLVYSPEAARLAANFLRHGRFSADRAPDRSGINAAR